MRTGRTWTSRLGLLCALLPVLVGCAASPPSIDGSDVVARSIRSSVQLFTERADHRRRAGSAIVLAVDEGSGRSLILTTAHLLEPPVEQTIFAKTPASPERSVATVIAVDAEADLALLEAKGLTVAPADLRTDSRLGDGIWVVSYPWGRRLTLVDGVVSQISWGAPDPASGMLPIAGPVRLIDAPVSYGSSGGGIFHRRTGQLVGIVRGYRTAKLSVPGSGGAPIELPIAGETTVIATPRILCFLKTAEVDEDLSAKLRLQVAGSDC